MFRMFRIGGSVVLITHLPPAPPPPPKKKKIKPVFIELTWIVQLSNQAVLN